jgi:hypothetical protein
MCTAPSHPSAFLRSNNSNLNDIGERHGDKPCFAPNFQNKHDDTREGILWLLMGFPTGPVFPRSDINSDAEPRSFTIDILLNTLNLKIGACFDTSRTLG